METFAELEKALKDIVIEVKDPSTKEDSFVKLAMIMRLQGFPSLMREGRHFIFENARGISVVRGEGTYGFKYGLFEVAILDKNNNLDFNTKITNSVIGYCDIKKVVNIAKRVAKLK